MSGSSNTIFIQQDNAMPHIDANDAEFLKAVGRYGFDIRLCCRPPNSPDLNVLDLGFLELLIHFSTKRLQLQWTNLF